MSIQKMDFAGATFLANKDIGRFPYLQLIFRDRVGLKKALNVAVVGEAGSGKSYLAWALCLLLDSKFSVDQIVYTYAEYMRLIRKLPMRRPIMFDEPSYAMGKRDWYKQLNKVLVQTIESQRFKVHPLFIPIINMSLLDKTIRDHLIQFVIHIIKRGRVESNGQIHKGIANVYRLYASQWEERTYHPFVCQLRYPMITLCSKDSCLGCEKLNSCQEFRAKYERKKATIQDQRYEQAEMDASKLESSEMTDTQLERLIYTRRDKILNDKGQVDAKLIRIVFLRDFRIKIGHNKAYTIKKLLEYDFKDEFA